MNRRKFLNNTIKACASSLLAESVLHEAFASSHLLNAIQDSCTNNILIVVQLVGGNDGLNTIIPLDQYSALSLARKNILIPENKVLATKKYSGTGFHPSMTGAHALFESNKLSIVQGCSYQNPDFSHFRATDIIMSGSDANEYIPNGWIGRELDEIYPNYPTNYPNATFPDPLAIQMGSNTTLALEGRNALLGLSVSSITQNYSLFPGFSDPLQNTRAGYELGFLRGISSRADQYSTRIVTAANAQKTNLSSLYPANDPLSAKFRNIARLIKGGLQTKVYMVSVTGFDTHAYQTIASDPTLGTHANLLDSLSQSIAGFQDDLEKMGINKRVTGMVFSEFGRRIKSNASNGTDHGSGMPILLFGSELKGGMYGTNPVIPTQATVNDNVAMQHDYRSVYYSLLKDWFCFSKSQLDNVFGKKTYPYLSLFKPGSIVTNTEDVFLEQRTDQLTNIYPNPLADNGFIAFNTSGGNVRLDLLDMEGRPIKVISESYVSPGAHQVQLERNDLPKGIYLVRMSNGTFQETKKVILK